MALENIYDGLTEEQKAKAKACTTPEELIDLAKNEGVELSEEQLDAVAGGSWNSTGDCGPYRRMRSGSLH